MCDCDLLVHSSFSMYCCNKYVPYVANVCDEFCEFCKTFGCEIFCAHTLYVHNIVQRWQAAQGTRVSMEDLVLGVINALKHNRTNEVIDI